jgi:hypothetical protein
LDGQWGNHSLERSGATTVWSDSDQAHSYVQGKRSGQHHSRQLCPSSRDDAPHLLFHQGHDARRPYGNPVSIATRRELFPVKVGDTVNQSKPESTADIACAIRFGEVQAELGNDAASDPAVAGEPERQKAMTKPPS